MAITKEREAEKIPMTVRLPRPLYEQAKGIVESRAAHVDSLNDLVIAAILSYLETIKRKQIDLAFRGMAEDTDFQKESQLIVSEFERSDWDALELGEKS